MTERPYIVERRSPEIPADVERALLHEAVGMSWELNEAYAALVAAYQRGLNDRSPDA